MNELNKKTQKPKMKERKKTVKSVCSAHCLMDRERFMPVKSYVIKRK